MAPFSESGTSSQKKSSKALQLTSEVVAENATRSAAGDSNQRGTSTPILDELYIKLDLDGKSKTDRLLPDIDGSSSVRVLRRNLQVSEDLKAKLNNLTKAIATELGPQAKLKIEMPSTSNIFIDWEVVGVLIVFGGFLIFLVMLLVITAITFRYLNIDILGPSATSVADILNDPLFDPPRRRRSQRVQYEGRDERVGIKQVYYHLCITGITSTLTAD